MGAGASASSSAAVKAFVAAVPSDDLRAAFSTLSDDQRAKIADALSTSNVPSETSSKRAVPESMRKLVRSREIWESNRAKFYAWIDKTPEEALEPDLEIVDSHHHLWDMRELSGFNLFGMMKQQYYMTDDLVDDCVGGGHNVTHSVFVTTHSFFRQDADPPWMAPLGEVQFAQGAAAQFASGKYGRFRGVAGIVGSADLAKYGAEVEPLLVACKAASPNFRGIRCNAAHDPLMQESNFHPAPHMFAEPKFREGFALLQKHGLVFDAWLFAMQLPDLHDLARAFPDTTIVLNHVGTPLAALGNVAGAPGYDGKQAEILAQWKERLGQIARDCLNVYVKVGGLALPHLGHGLDARERPASSQEVAELFGDAYLWTIETFGPSRCMFESNFPVDKVSMSYTVLWNAYKRITKDAGLSDGDRALLFSGTAKRVYRL